ncbi:MAG: hypothetical protein QRY71_00405 [Candidatus Rhabdochlamydia sp.]
MSIMNLIKQFYYTQVPPSISVDVYFKKALQEQHPPHEMDRSFLMRNHPLPTSFLNIFDPYTLIQCKEAYRSLTLMNFEEENYLHRFHKVSQLEFSRLSTHTLEGYHVDKHFSNLVRIEAVEKYFQLIKLENLQHQQKIEGLTASVPDLAQSFVDLERTNLNSLFIYQELTFAEYLSIDRMIDRMTRHIKQELIKEIPLPSFQDASHISLIQKKLSKGMSISKISLKNPTPEDHQLYLAYQKQLDQEETKRVYEWMDNSLASDQALRSHNPQALLTHLTTVPSLELAIQRKKKQLIYQILKISAVSGAALMALYCLTKNYTLLKKAIQVIPSQFEKALGQLPLGYQLLIKVNLLMLGFTGAFYVGLKLSVFMILGSLELEYKYKKGALKRSEW